MPHDRIVALTALAAALLAGCAGGASRTADVAAESVSAHPTGQCEPLETRDPNGAGQRPAFSGQTRACGIRSGVALEVRVVASGLQKPWSVEPLPDGTVLVTEKAGRMRIVSATGQVGEPIAGVPEVAASGQGGLLDAALSPDFARDRTIFWSYAETRLGEGSGTSVARGVLSPDGTRLDQVRVILRTRPSYGNGMHFGSRLAFGPDGMLYVTMGDRADRVTRSQAQEPGSHLGKTLRIAPDGSVPPDNPFQGQAGALPEIFSMGHRNIQAAAFDPAGQFWIIEHGTRGGDELNRVEAGKNYGWPVQAYGVEYRGGTISSALGEASPAREGIEQPVYYWDPVIAPSGAEFYTGDLFPAWRGSLFVGGLASMRLVRLELAGGRVRAEEHLLVDRNRRIRDVRQGPDGALYVVTDAENGELWRISPAR